LNLLSRWATKAIDHQVGDSYRWFERRAQVHIALAHKSGTRISIDSAVREVDLAIADFRRARHLCSGDIQYRQMDLLLAQAQKLRSQLSANV